MSEIEEPAPPAGVSRRTVAKAMAWSVPVIAVAATVPSAAASAPPPPFFDFGKGCATVGNGAGGCSGTPKTPQVPGYATNSTGAPLVLQIIGAQSRVLNDAQFFSDYTVWNFNGREDQCAPQVPASGCEGYPSFAVGPGATVDFWVVGHEFGNSSSFEMNITYRWIQPCSPPSVPTVVSGPTPTGFTLVNPSNNCDGSIVTLP